ncbi:hypothetical protein [Streptomyces sp. NBC_01594]|uniref:hypothetical protein n=1 Tax=Streptomyces sp. NBC_01594 TaxID=2975890 RepID=UPI00386FF1A7
MLFAGAQGPFGGAFVAGGGVCDGLDRGEPGCGDGGQVGAELAAGAGDQAQSFGGVACLHLELGEAAGLVGAEQRVTGGACGFDRRAVPGAGGAVVGHVPGKPADEGCGLGADGGHAGLVGGVGGLGGNALDEPQVGLCGFGEVAGADGGVQAAERGGGHAQGGCLAAVPFGAGL